jgi:hypothetical protein
MGRRLKVVAWSVGIILKTVEHFLSLCGENGFCHNSSLKVEIAEW